MDDVEFSEVEETLARAGVSPSAAELHGFITGWVCADARQDPSHGRTAVVEWLEVGPDEALRGLLERLQHQTATGLGDEALGFRLLLPEDEASATRRTSAVSEWCSGFLAGVGMTGRFQGETPDGDLREVFEDLAQIAALSGEVPDDDENEADLTEIIEYVRVSALIVYTECSQRAANQGGVQ